MNKPIFLLCICLLFKISAIAQLSPIKQLLLKKEATQTPADKYGSTWFYTVKFEVVDSINLASVVFNLKSISTGAVVNTQDFILPLNDGAYQNGVFPQGIIKDHKTYYLLLGNVKSLDALTLTADFVDSNKIHYDNIPITE